MFSRSKSSIDAKQSPTRLLRVMNALAVVGVFMIVALTVNQPLRAELTKGIVEGQADKEVANQAAEPVQAKTSFEKVSLTAMPEVVKAPVPSIAPLANKIPDSQIDPIAQNTNSLSSADQQILVSEYMANKYRANPARVREYVSHVVAAAKEVNLDPVLLVAVMAIESNFNPNAQSFAGAQGLMQVMTSVHLDKYAAYGGAKAAFVPEANIRVGAYILKVYIAMGGSMQKGLRYYVGGSAVSADGGYAGKVLRERDELLGMLQKSDSQTASRPPIGFDI